MGSFGKLLPGNVFLSICGSVCLGVSRIGTWTVGSDGTWSFEPASSAHPAMTARDRGAFEAELPVLLGLVPHAVTMRPADTLMPSFVPQTPEAPGRLSACAQLRHHWSELSHELRLLDVTTSFERSI